MKDSVNVSDMPDVDELRGMARSAFEVALAFSRDRTSFGRPIFEHQSVQFMHLPTHWVDIFIYHMGIQML